MLAGPPEAQGDKMLLELAVVHDSKFRQDSRLSTLGSHPGGVEMEADEPEYLLMPGGASHFMFERYTEKARRVIFFARAEASQFGSPYIETEHLLLGLLREDKALANRFLRSQAAVESIRKQIEERTTIRGPVSTSVDLPLSHECMRVLAYGAEEAGLLNHKHIGTEHLLLGLLREKCLASESCCRGRGRSDHQNDRPNPAYILRTVRARILSGAPAG
jgi:hypothetical protein